MSRTTLPVCPKTGSTSPSLTVHLCLHTALLREIGNAPDQRAVAAASGKHAQSVRNWTRQGMPVERVGRFCRYDVEVCRAWLAARPTRFRRGRRRNGGTLNVPISAGV